ncbi:MAG: hypothetical protein IPL43_07835 [Micropruina sp.]|nr:hypothetical protein [Micropruina sp.]
MGESTATSSADGSSATAAGGTAIGAAVAITYANLLLDATINAPVSAVGVSTSATVPTATNQFGASATSGAGGGDLGVAGSIAITVIEILADAMINATISAGGGNVNSTASSTSITVTEALPGEDGISGTKTGVGVSFALSVIDDVVTAGIADGVGVSGGDDILIAGHTSHDTTTTAKTGAKGATAVAPAIAITISNVTTRASLGFNGGITVAVGDVSVIAEQDAQAKTIASGDTEGSDTSVGIALAFTYAVHTVEALVKRSLNAAGTITVTALGASVVTADATASAAGSPQETGSTPANGVDQQVAGERANADTVATGAGAQGTQAGNGTPSASNSSGTVSVAAAIGISLGWSTSRAAILTGLVIVAGGAIIIESGARTTVTAKADGSAKTSNADATTVGVAVAIAYADNTNQATVGTATTLAANGISTVARNRDGPDAGTDPDAHSFGATSVSGASGGKTGVAGSLSLTIVISRTTAALDAASVNAGAGDVTLNATYLSSTTTSAKAGGFDTPAANTGVGLSVALSIIDTDTIARIATAPCCWGPTTSRSPRPPPMR